VRSTSGSTIDGLCGVVWWEGEGGRFALCTGIAIEGLRASGIHSVE